MGQPQESVRVTVSLQGRDHAALSDLAERHDVSLSWLVRRAVTEFVQRHGRGDGRLVLHPSNPDGGRRE